MTDSRVYKRFAILFEDGNVLELTPTALPTLEEDTLEAEVVVIGDKLCSAFFNEEQVWSIKSLYAKIYNKD